MNDAIKKLLAALGLPQAQIDALAAISDAKDLKVEDFVTPIKTNFQTQFLNDDTFLESIPEEKTSKTVKKQIESSQYARFMNETQDVTREFAISLDDLTPEEKKSLKGTLRAAIKKAQASGADSKTITDLQDKLSQVMAEKTKAETEAEKRVNDAVSSTSKKYADKLEKANAIAILNGQTTVPAEYVVDTALGKVKEKYTVSFNPETLTAELKQKANPQLDVLRQDGSRITLKDALVEQIKEDGIYKEIEKEETIAPKTEKIEVTGDATKAVVASYIEKKMQPALAQEAVPAK